jgi:hypothetical protein
MDFLLHEREGLLLLLLIAVLPFAIYFDNKTKKRRFAHYAKMGFAPTTKEKFMRWASLGNFSILGMMGFFRNSHEYMVGEYRGHRIGLFLHIVADGSKTGKRQTAAVIKLEDRLPHFVLRPEWFRDKVKARFGNEDINFEDDRLFSKKYFLQGRNGNEIRKLFGSENVRDYFSKNDGMWLESDGSQLLIFQEHDMLTDGKRMRRIVERAIRVKALMEHPDPKPEPFGDCYGSTPAPVPVQIPPSMEWNVRNSVIVLSVLIAVISTVYFVYADSKQAYDERMAMYHRMTTQEMAAYLADINAEPEQIDAVTKHAGTDLNGTVIYMYRELQSNFLSEMIVDVNDIDAEKAKMARQLKREMCGFPTWDLFYNRGGEVVYVYHLLNSHEKTFLFDITINKAFCL